MIKTCNSKLDILIIDLHLGHLDRTFSAEVPVSDSKDPFAISGQPNSSGQTKLGIDERDPKFMQSKWCYDTPGVVQPDQVITFRK